MNFRIAAASGASLILAGLFIQKGNVLALRGHGNRFQIGVDVGDVLLRYRFARVRRHVIGRIANVALERLERKNRRTDPRGPGLGRALSQAAVAFVTAITHKEFLAVLGVSRGRRIGGLLRPSGRQPEQDGYQDKRKARPFHYAKLLDDSSSCYRGCVTTSTRAGSPCFTTSIARFSAGPRSFGSVMGPSPCTPMLSAS